MKKNPIISIIVPVYNIENYLPFCLKSIQSQTFTDFECILIDDGSTDSSGIICDKISKEDSRFRVIHQNNSGQSVARNIGISHSTGEYVSFIDGDDYIHPQMIDLLYNTIKNKNNCLAISRIKYTNNNQLSFTNIQNPHYSILSQDCTIKALFGDSGIDIQFQSTCNKLYPREIIANIFFNNITSEDTDFNLRIFLKMQSAFFIESDMYYYVQRESSTVHQRFNKYQINTLDSYYKMYQYIPANKIEYKAYCIYKLYKRILNIRYYARFSEYQRYAVEKIDMIKKDTWKDFWKNSHINLSQKITISFLYNFPVLYRSFMWYCNHK